jgi:hypothetical protein
MNADVAVIRVIRVKDQAPEPDEPVLKYPAITREFLFGGRAYFRVGNPQNESLLYLLKSRAGRQGTEWAGEVSYFLNVFVPQGSKFVFIGVVNPETGDLVSVGRSQFLAGQREYEAAQWAIKSVMNQAPIEDGYSITHDGRCGKCGRYLTSTGDREAGLHLDCTD